MELARKLARRAAAPAAVLVRVRERYGGNLSLEVLLTDIVAAYRDRQAETPRAFPDVVRIMI
jgi:hypothetical protein